MAKSVTIDEGIDSLLIIPLESSPEAIIGTIEKLIVSDSLVFIKDDRYSKAIFVFDMAGHFQYKISNVGAGPREYEDFIDFDVRGRTFMLMKSLYPNHLIAMSQKMLVSSSETLLFHK